MEPVFFRVCYCHDLWAVEAVLTFPKVRFFFVSYVDAVIYCRRAQAMALKGEL